MPGELIERREHFLSERRDTIYARVLWDLAHRMAMEAVHEPADMAQLTQLLFDAAIDFAASPAAEPGFSDTG